MAECETTPLDLTVRNEISGSSSGHGEQPLDLTKKEFQLTQSATPPRESPFAEPRNYQLPRIPHTSPISSMEKVFEHAHSQTPITKDVASFLPALGMPPDNAALTMLQRSMLSGLFERSQQMINAANYLQNAKTSEKRTSVRHHCTYCGWQCHSLTMTAFFKKHLEDHANQTGSAYKCVYCSQEFHDPNVLKEHLTTHPFLHQYVCSFCSMAFCNEDFLQAHIKVHDLSNIKSRPTKEPSCSPSERKPRFTTLPDRKACINSPPAETKEKMSVIGRSLAKHIEEAIAKELTTSNARTPSNIGDLIFMSSKRVPAASKKQLPKVQEGGLNLLSLLGKVVEQGLQPESETRNRKAQLKFMVTFSDDEDEGFSSTSLSDSGNDSREEIHTQKAECTSSVEEQEKDGDHNINVVDDPSSSNEAEAREKITPKSERKRQLQQAPASPVSSDNDTKPTSSCDTLLPHNEKEQLAPKRCKSA